MNCIILVERLQNRVFVTMHGIYYATLVFVVLSCTGGTQIICCYRWLFPYHVYQNIELPRACCITVIDRSTSLHQEINWD